MGPGTKTTADGQAVWEGSVGHVPPVPEQTTSTVAPAKGGDLTGANDGAPRRQEEIEPWIAGYDEQLRTRVRWMALQIVAVTGAPLALDQFVADLFVGVTRHLPELRQGLTDVQALPWRGPSARTFSGTIDQRNQELEQQEAEQLALHRAVQPVAGWLRAARAEAVTLTTQFIRAAVAAHNEAVQEAVATNTPVDVTYPPRLEAVFAQYQPKVFEVVVTLNARLAELAASLGSVAENTQGGTTLVAKGTGAGIGHPPGRAATHSGGKPRRHAPATRARQQHGPQHGAEPGAVPRPDSPPTQPAWPPTMMGGPPPTPEQMQTFPDPPYGRDPNQPNRPFSVQELMRLWQLVKGQGGYPQGGYPPGGYPPGGYPQGGYPPVGDQQVGNQQVGYDPNAGQAGPVAVGQDGRVHFLADQRPWEDTVLYPDGDARTRDWVSHADESTLRALAPDDRVAMIHRLTSGVLSQDDLAAIQALGSTADPSEYPMLAQAVESNNHGLLGPNSDLTAVSQSFRSQGRGPTYGVAAGPVST